MVAEPRFDERPSTRIRGRLADRGIPFHASANIADHLVDGELEELEDEVAQAAEALLEALVIDWRADPNARETPERIARMLLREVASGRYEAPPKLTAFPNEGKLDEVYTVGPLMVRSLCAHHFAPILGKLWIGVIPGTKLVGLSKFSRIARWVLARPQMQEAAAIQLANELERRIYPLGLAVVIRAQHHCMTWRGVREDEATMTTSIMRGIFLDDRAAREEFLAVIRGQGA